MNPDLAREEATLAARREPYARVVVVWSQAPVSARAGDAALVTLDGRLRGWIGGSCSEPVVVRQALDALASGAPRLVLVGPADELPAGREGIVVEPVSCASEGTLELFVEPRVPPPHLVVVGRSPMVGALATMAGTIGFDVVVAERDVVDAAELGGARVVPELDLEKAGVAADSFVVVATMGRYDEDAVEAALASGARHVALVASARRAGLVRQSLAGAGVDVERLRSPAGLDLGDVAHHEIAVAVLAEIVAEKARGAVPVARPAAPAATAVDPVCGMTVEVGAPDHVTRDGQTWWFCSAGCRRRFEQA